LCCLRHPSSGRELRWYLLHLQSEVDEGGIYPYLMALYDAAGSP
jgi:hypothetical protein